MPLSTKDIPMFIVYRSFKIREVHWEVIFDYMSRNPDFCRGRINNSPENRKAYNNMWRELTEKLNSLGFGQKPCEKWQKVYNFKFLSMFQGIFIPVCPAGLLFVCRHFAICKHIPINM